ncbi:MAG: hypothetical protein CMN17_14025 [Roseovarius sp.]|jgi:hypothetical protein|nr:hypothetical protein [Roseovarius sp.]|tara:strand:+ start:2199 stop:2537 length:339 start_codon:yes stop_codon:yes gene_type:complete
MAMKKFGTFIFAAIIGASSIMPAMAQNGATRIGNESALEMANRINACNGAGVVSAQFTDGGTLLEVTCRNAAAGDLSGGLGTAGAVALGTVVVAVIAAAASGGGSSSTTTTN